MKTTEIHYSEYSDWQPQAYLADYYAEVMPDVRFTLEFLVESLRNLPPVSVALDFGCGPTVPYILPIVPKVQEIHMADYLSSNRSEVEKWLLSRDDAHNWREFTLEVLRLEGTASVDAANLREQEARSCIKQVLPGDATQADPLGSAMREFYPLVTTHYCVESISSSKEKWHVYMQNVMSLVKPGGILILSACGGGNFYRVGNCCFPGAGINEQDILASLNNNFTDINLSVRQVPDNSEQGFSKIIFACAVKAV